MKSRKGAVGPYSKGLSLIHFLRKDSRLSEEDVFHLYITTYPHCVLPLFIALFQNTGCAHSSPRTVMQPAGWREQAAAQSWDKMKSFGHNALPESVHKAFCSFPPPLAHLWELHCIL